MISLETYFEARRLERQLGEAGAVALGSGAAGRYAPPAPARSVRPRHGPTRRLTRVTRVTRLGPIAVLALVRYLALLHLS